MISLIRRRTSGAALICRPAGPDGSEQAAPQVVVHAVGDRLGIGGHGRARVADHGRWGARHVLAGQCQRSDFGKLGTPAFPVCLGPGAGERQPGIMFHRPPVHLRVAQLLQHIHPLASQVTLGTVEVSVHDHCHGGLPGPGGTRRCARMLRGSAERASGNWHRLPVCTRRLRESASVPTGESRFQL